MIDNLFLYFSLVQVKRTELESEKRGTTPISKRAVPDPKETPPQPPSPTPQRPVQLPRMTLPTQDVFQNAFINNGSIPGGTNQRS